MQPKTLASQIDNGRGLLLEDWMTYQLSALTRRRDLINDDDLKQESLQFLRAFVKALQETPDINAPEWDPVKDILTRLSGSRAALGFSPSETAIFVFSLKQPLFDFIYHRSGENRTQQLEEAWSLSILLDKLGLYTTEVYQQRREKIIQRQQQELLELSTPVVKLWEDIVALPLIGTLDSARAQIVMENLLERLVETRAKIAIIDITGVATMDTLVAQHLLKTVAAARLMGSDCIISGIRPEISQSIVHLGIDLGSLITKATLADAFAMALQQRAATVESSHLPAPIVER